MLPLPAPFTLDNVTMAVWPNVLVAPKLKMSLGCGALPAEPLLIFWKYEPL